LLRLLLLAAIWGGSFLLIRIGAPALGPVAADGGARAAGSPVPRRGRSGAAAAAGLARRTGATTCWSDCFNSALPFLLFGYAALTLSAAMLSILNATSPLWGALIGAALAARAARPPHARPDWRWAWPASALLVGFDRHRAAAPAPV
jgi:drug/metabolite transporter (DMT)-like permease